MTVSDERQMTHYVGDDCNPPHPDPQQTEREWAMVAALREWVELTGSDYNDQHIEFIGGFQAGYDAAQPAR